MSSLWQSSLHYLRFGMALLLFATLIYSAGISALIGVLMNVSLPWLCIAICVNLIYFIIGAFNIWIVLTALHSIPFAVFLRNYVASLVVSFFMPGQVGDSSLVLFLKRDNTPISMGSTAYLVDKLITLCLSCILAWYSCILFLPQIHKVYFFILPIGVLLFGLLFLYAIFAYMSDFTYLAYLKSYLVNVRVQLAILANHWPILFANFILSCLKWLTMSLFFALTFYASGFRVPWPEIGLIPILASLIGYIPISVGGLGTVEYTAVYLFGLVGVGSTGVLTTYLIMRFIQYTQGFILIIIFRGKREIFRNIEAKDHE
ncbi:MAG: flippase-like domain-containing protein [candidate division Zixibacteria bacterium]|nr:flippase-like domain-containing protein [candidate division Zixibacteria bacterium]